MCYCDVLILDIVHGSMDRPFTYKVPEHMAADIWAGSLVKVNFRNQNVNGIVLNTKRSPELENIQKIKLVSSLVMSEPVISTDLFKLAEWMKKYYICPLAKIIRMMLPRGVLIDYTSKYQYIITFDPETLRNFKLAPNARKQKQIVDYLTSQGDEKGGLPLIELKEKLGCSTDPIKKLEQLGAISIEKRFLYREPVDYDEVDKYPVKSLTEDQQEAFEYIDKEIYANNSSPVLMLGVTGSGKTEIYLHLIEKVLAEDKQVIVLIPEISLTPQTVSRFMGRFGRKVALIHSRLSVGERYDEWLKILKGEAKIVVGARSAVFAPLSNLGMIIIDEEHENAYKQEESPMYHAREVARKRCEINGASLVLGSATPSLESYHEAQKGNFKLVKLSKRINSNMPAFCLVDMRKELAGGNKSIFSREMVKGIKSAVDEKGRVLLFLNRRGYSTFVLCRSCGHVVRCSDCEVSLTYHKNVNYLRCHYCDYVEPLPGKCPECNSNMIRSFGAGTERIETEVKKYFPWLRTLRMDVDTTSKKNAHQEILNKFKDKKAEVLIGTQMIAKGLDFPDISLVGVVSADTILNIPDFRSGEKTYQLLSQVGGRGGRGETPGKVILQTYTPEHYSIRSVLEADYESFAAKELESREKLEYPPYKSIIKIEFKGPKEEEVEQSAKTGMKILTEIISKDREQVDDNDQKLRDIEIIGPHPCPFYRLRGEYRWQLILKGRNFERIKPELYQKRRVDFEGELSKSVKVAIDVDPVSLL